MQPQNNENNLKIMFYHLRSLILFKILLTEYLLLKWKNFEYIFQARNETNKYTYLFVAAALISWQNVITSWQTPKYSLFIAFWNIAIQKLIVMLIFSIEMDVWDENALFNNGLVTAAKQISIYMPSSKNTTQFCIKHCIKFC